MSGRIGRSAIALLALGAGLGSILLGGPSRLVFLASVGGLLLLLGEVTARLDEQRAFSGQRRRGPKGGGDRRRLSRGRDLGTGVVIGLAGAVGSYGLVRLGTAVSGGSELYLVAGIAGVALAIGALAYLARPERLG